MLCELVQYALTHPSASAKTNKQQGNFSLFVTMYNAFLKKNRIMITGRQITS